MSNVFVSYAHADAADVRPISEVLRDQGLDVWSDDREIEDFASIPAAIVEGIGGSKALLAYYSRTYPTRRPCQWELTAAFVAAQREGQPERRILVINPEIGDAHIFPIELRNALYVRPPADGSRAALDKLAQAVARHVAALDGTTWGRACDRQASLVRTPSPRFEPLRGAFAGSVARPLRPPCRGCRSAHGQDH